jgi:hypothetical protein
MRGQYWWLEAEMETDGTRPKDPQRRSFETGLVVIESANWKLDE